MHKLRSWLGGDTSCGDGGVKLQRPFGQFQTWAHFFFQTTQKETRFFNPVGVSRVFFLKWSWDINPAIELWHCSPTIIADILDLSQPGSRPGKDCLWKFRVGWDVESQGTWIVEARYIYIYDLISRGYIQQASNNPGTLLKLQIYVFIDVVDLFSVSAWIGFVMQRSISFYSVYQVRQFPWCLMYRN